MKKTRLIALLAACVMLLTSCGGAQGGSEGKQEGSTSAEAPKTEQSTEQAPAEEAYSGPKDYRGWTTSMATFNPHMYTNSKTFMNLGTFVAMLANKDGENKLEFVPHHASELPTTSDGGTTWNIKIREGLT